MDCLFLPLKRNEDGQILVIEMGLKADANRGSSIMRKVNDSIISNLTARPETSGRSLRQDASFL